MKAQRGVTLVEALLAFLILFIVMLAILEMFALSIAVNRGCLARTDLAYRCERVIETIRFQTAIAPAARSACVPLTGTFPVTLPPGTTCDAYWGAAGVNVIMADAPFTISYTIANGVLTVEGRANLSGTQYLGQANVTKVVRYVAHL
jgi:Tfp pilus assembly protein PilV